MTTARVSIRSTAHCGVTKRSARTRRVVGASGQTVQFHIERLDTVEDLQQSMSIGAEVDVYGPFASGSARCDFAESCSIHDYSVFLLVRTEVSNSFRYSAMSRSSRRRSSCSARSDGRFREQFGDVFVRGLATGGLLFAVLELTAPASASSRTSR